MATQTQLVLIAVAVGALAVVLAVSAWRPGCRGGWSLVEGLANPNNVKKGQLEDDTNFINRECGPKGNTYESVVSRRSSLLKRYNAGDIKWQCDHARNQFVVDARDQKRKPGEDNPGNQGNTEAKCGKRKVCPDAGLRARYPCTNNKGDKCCAVDDNGRIISGKKMCIELTGQTAALGNESKDYRDKCTRGECPDRQLRAKYQCLSLDGKSCCDPLAQWSGKGDGCAPLKSTQRPVARQGATGITDEGEKLKGCKFSATVMSDNRWQCPRTHPHLTNVGAGPSNDTWGHNRQCAATKKCAKDAGEFAKNHSYYGQNYIDRDRHPA